MLRRMAIQIRAAHNGDGPAIREIERAGGERFREIGMPEVADDEPPSLAVLAAYAAAGSSWVAVDARGTPVGYALADVVDGNAHLEQVTVHPDEQGRGVGRALIDAVRDWAVETGRSAVTLTAFADVAWNAPLYRHLGFRDLADAELGPELRALRDRESEHGLDPSSRVCMRLEVSASRGRGGR
jgi:GNAT superfamily N-acetyltransferase